MIIIKDEYGTTTKVKDLAELTQRYLDCVHAEQDKREPGDGKSPAQVKFTKVTKRKGKVLIDVEVVDDMGRSWQETVSMKEAIL